MSAKNSSPPSKELVGSVESETALDECFVIMPISDQPGYDASHFTKVYEDIFKPACEAAGYKANRADDVKESNLIHLDILKRVVHSPMAICDLSSRNPNVLFELGLRQAFDRPTILVKDKETPEIFDIAPIRYTTYRQALRYREVIEDQHAIANALRATKHAIGQEHNVNSLIKLLELAGPATINENRQSEPQEYFQILMAELTNLRQEVQELRMPSKRWGGVVRMLPPQVNFQRLLENLLNIENMISGGSPEGKYVPLIEEAIKDTEVALRQYRLRGDMENPDVFNIETILKRLRSLEPL